MTRDEHIVELFQAGHSQHAIAKTLGLSQPGVRKILLRLGWLTPKIRERRGEEIVNTPSPPRQTLPPRINKHNHTAAVPMSDNQSQEPAKNRESLLRQAIAAGARRCEWCHGWFAPRRLGQRFCCNICGFKGEGLHPIVPEPHTEDCPLLLITG